MGSPLGCTFADFYMANLESSLLSQSLTSNPIFYYRYVDDIIAIFKSKNHVNYFLRRLSTNSILKFTVEHMEDNQFHFLDISMNFLDGKLNTSVHIKPTDSGSYSNFSSHTPLQYKLASIKTLIHRALRISSTWENCISEINRIKQVFINCNYPLSLIDSVINRIVSNHFSNNVNSPSDNDIKLYIQLDNVRCFNNDKKELNSIINVHVKCNNDYKICLLPYYKPFKLTSCFSTRTKCQFDDRTRVVYQFKCTEDRCNASYVGYTTNSILTRCKQHRYSSSSVYNHYSIDHHMNPPSADILIKNFSILYSSPQLPNLKTAEAIIIKQTNPYINVKYNEFFHSLTLF